MLVVPWLLLRIDGRRTQLSSLESNDLGILDQNPVKYHRRKRSALQDKRSCWLLHLKTWLCAKIVSRNPVNGPDKAWFVYCHSMSFWGLNLRRNHPTQVKKSAAHQTRNLASSQTIRTWCPHWWLAFHARFAWSEIVASGLPSSVERPGSGQYI